jgi:hypothetical protein
MLICENYAVSECIYITAERTKVEHGKDEYFPRT